jgi:hypothetical protein
MTLSPDRIRHHAHIPTLDSFTTIGILLTGHSFMDIVAVP